MAGEFIATHQESFSSSCRLAGSRSPLSLSSSHCFIHLSASETSGSGLKLFESKYYGGHFLLRDVFFNFWFAVLFPSKLNALVSAVQLFIIHQLNGFIHSYIWNAVNSGKDIVLYDEYEYFPFFE